MKGKQQQQSSTLPNTRKVILINSSGYQFTSTPQKQIKYNIQETANQNTNTVNRETGSTTQQKPNTQQYEHKNIQNQVSIDGMELIIKSLFQITQQITKLSSRLNTLEDKLYLIQEKAQTPLSDLRKKVRRRAQEINKDFICSEVNCGKAYGSDISLNLHLRLKHPNRARQCQAEKERQKFQRLTQQNIKKLNKTSSCQDK